MRQCWTFDTENKEVSQVDHDIYSLSLEAHDLFKQVCSLSTGVELSWNYRLWFYSTWTHQSPELTL